MTNAHGWHVQWAIAERVHAPDGEGFCSGILLSEMYEEPGPAHLALQEIRKVVPIAGLFRYESEFSA